MITRILASVVIVTALATPALAANKVIGSFNGYCDGFELTLKKNGSASGRMTGCESGVIAGTYTKKKIYYAPEVYPPALYVIDVKGTWLIYDSNGKIVNKGKWKSRAPLAKSEEPSTTGK